MTKCNAHKDFFDENCSDCQAEHREMMVDAAVHQDLSQTARTYKEFTEERAKTLYQELMLQYIKEGDSDDIAASKARAIIKKQCRIRDQEPWSWV